MSGPWQSRPLLGGLSLHRQWRRGPGILAARLWVRGGSGEDPSGQRGLHQLLAGVMTRGCGNLDAEALADLVEGRGAELRCEASEDSLVFSLKCAAEDSADLLPLLISMARQPHLDADQVELERSSTCRPCRDSRRIPSSSPTTCCGTSSTAMVPMAMTLSASKPNWLGWDRSSCRGFCPHWAVQERCWCSAVPWMGAWRTPSTRPWPAHPGWWLHPVRVQVLKRGRASVSRPAPRRPNSWC
ncbi:insulinase family protein [Synechococcus sp. GFB01]|uniref:insulinase family protein n=1 Tax=Synechococcus sp. GFB01 TaxID=1662190 RepID=UPI001F19E87A|nr:insulinase family protein [Synechococcus sp. GFB01]